MGLFLLIFSYYSAEKEEKKSEKWKFYLVGLNQINQRNKTVSQSVSQSPNFSHTVITPLFLIIETFHFFDEILYFCFLLPFICRLLQQRHFICNKGKYWGKGKKKMCHVKNRFPVSSVIFDLRCLSRLHFWDIFLKFYIV